MGIVSGPVSPPILPANNEGDYQAPLTPGRKRNKDNSVYGQLPNHFNSPMTATKVFGRGNAHAVADRYNAIVSNGIVSNGELHSTPGARVTESNLGKFDIDSEAAGEGGCTEGRR